MLHNRYVMRRGLSSHTVTVFCTAHLPTHHVNLPRGNGSAFWNFLSRRGLELSWLRESTQGSKSRRSWREQMNWRREENCRNCAHAWCERHDLAPVAQGAAAASARICRDPRGERARSHARRGPPNCRTPTRKFTVAAAGNRSTS